MLLRIFSSLILVFIVQESQAETCRAFLTKEAVLPLDIALETLNLESRESWLAFFRKTNAHSDYKFISDLVIKKMTEAERTAILKAAKQYRSRIYQNLIAQGADFIRAKKQVQTAYARRLMERLFQPESGLSNLPDSEISPRKVGLTNERVKEGPSLKRLRPMVEAIEHTWPTLIKKTKIEKGGSRLSSKFPQLFAGGRFSESYYWDSFFGSLGLTISGRRSLAEGQLQNFLDHIDTYGLIPNGSREYYLSRSQPPVVSMLAKHLYTSEKANSLEKLINLLEKDYNGFWMKQRFNSEYNLNFHSDAHNSPRPERHSNDDDSLLGETFRDVRAEAESGQDFTSSFMGKASKVLPVQLNAFLFRYEMDIADFLKLQSEDLMLSSRQDALIKKNKADFYLNKAEQRRLAILSTLAVGEGLYRNFDFESGKHSEILSGDVFSLLFVGALTDEEVSLSVPKLLTLLEAEGGIRASTDKSSTKQWDGNHGWAPYQIMAVAGLDKYGYKKEARRIALKWVETNLNIFESAGAFYEKVDVQKMGLPNSDGHKYPNQTGFLWTNSSILWMLDYLGYNLKFEQE